MVRAAEDEGSVPLSVVDADGDHVGVMNACGVTIEGPVENYTQPVQAVTPDSVNGRYPLVVLAVTGLFAALGWAEDYRGVSVRARLAAQLGIGLAATAVLVAVLGTSAWWLPVGTLAIAAYVNMANFMDGINGISGLHGLAAGLLYAWAGASNDLPWMIAAGLAVAGGFAGFLPWNLGRGTVFLGDVGSYLLGGSLAGIAVAAVLSGVYVFRRGGSTAAGAATSSRRPSPRPPGSP